MKRVVGTASVDEFVDVDASNVADVAMANARLFEDVESLCVRRFSGLLWEPSLASLLGSQSTQAPTDGNEDGGKNDRLEHSMVLSFSADLLAAGYAVSQPLYHALMTFPNGFALTRTLSTARALKGANYTYEPMYPNFPQQVVEASDMELILNALLHYTGDEFGVRVMPDYAKDPRAALLDVKSPMKLGVVTISQLHDLLCSLVESGSVWSEQDWHDVLTLARLADEDIWGPFDVIDVMKAGINSHENLATLAAAKYLNDGYGEGASDALIEIIVEAEAYFDLPTDVLRYAAKLSGYSVALDEPVRFKLTRTMRRAVLNRLQGSISHMLRNVDHDDDWNVVDSAATKLAYMNLDDQGAMHNEMWKHLFKTLHPYDASMAKLTSKDVKEWISRIQKGEVRSFAAQVEEALRLEDLRQRTGLGEDSLDSLLVVLSARPGVFARRLVETLRKVPAEDGQRVLDAFALCAGNVSKRVLVQLWNLMQPVRDGSFVPEVSSAATKRGRALLFDNRLTDTVDADMAARIMNLIDNALASKPKTLLTFVKSPAEDIAVPLMNRAASSGIRTLSRGSRLPIDDFREHGTTLRAFLYWHDLENVEPSAYGYGYNSRVDLDLSAVAASEDFRYVKAVSYRCLRSKGMTHSGDITSAPHGACEFVDIDVDELLAQGYRYVLPTVYSFTHTDFLDIPDASVGFMVRNGSSQAGEVFDAKTVADRWRLTGTTQSMTPCVFDIKTGTMVWADVQQVTSTWNAVEPHKKAIADTMRSLVESHPMTMAQFVKLTTGFVEGEKNVPAFKDIIVVDGMDMAVNTKLLV